MKKLILLLLWSMCYYHPALANDTSGSVAAGGITFNKTPFIKMVREELTISPNEVKVSYLFKNVSDKPITTTVLFPLPPYGSHAGHSANWDDVPWGPEEGKIEKDAAFVNFAVESNGKPVPYHTTRQALLEDGTDVTAKVTQAGLMQKDIFIGMADTPESDPDEYKLPSDALRVEAKKLKTKAQQLGLLDKDGNVRWDERVVFYWTQTFPAKQTMTITHTYKPEIGQPAAYLSKLSANIHAIDYNLDINLNQAENGSAFKAWLLQLQNRFGKKNEDEVGLRFYGVSYILTTGANWAGPIEKFVLKLKYDPKKAMVAYKPFFKNTASKITQTTDGMQISINHFTPTKDLDIVFGSIY